jgi:hypothetical protein
MTAQPAIDRRELLKRELGAILDHPSVFMGGASQQNKRKADRIIQHLMDHWGFDPDPR